MKRILVTESELKTIQAKRADQKHEKAEDRFRRKVIATAYFYNEHCEKNRCFPSFSDFVNDFEYQEEDSKIMFEAIKQVRELIKTFRLPRGKS
ncbi:hypothetical protein [Acinetobacter tandoii]